MNNKEKAFFSVHNRDQNTHTLLNLFLVDVKNFLHIINIISESHIACEIEFHYFNIYLFPLLYIYVVSIVLFFFFSLKGDCFKRILIYFMLFPIQVTFSMLEIYNEQVTVIIFSDRQF